MANDIRSHKDRRDALRNIQSLISSAIKASADAEVYLQKATGRNSAEQYDRIWTDVEARMAACEALAEQAKDELAALITNDGFHPRYVWEIGKNGVRQFEISETNDSIGIYGEFIDGTSNLISVFDNVANTIVLSPGDTVKISGTELNDGFYVVDTGSTATTLELVGTNLVDENVNTPGATLELWSV